MAKKKIIALSPQRAAILDRLRDDETVIFFEPSTLDVAIVGISEAQCNRAPCVIYDYQKLLAVFMEDMSEEDAEEWIAFNVLDGWLGEATPIVIDTLQLDLH